MPGDVRLTLIDSLGNVVDDNQYSPNQLRNLGGEMDVILSKQREWGRHIATGAGNEGKRRIFLTMAVYAPAENTHLGYIRASRTTDSSRRRTNKLFKQLSLTYGLIILSLGVITNTITRKRTRNLRQLFDDVERLENGEDESPVQVHWGDATEKVADRLNRLSDAVNQLQRNLNDQRHQQQVLLKSMSEGILAIDNHHNVTQINPIAADWLGVATPLRVAGAPLYSVTRQPRLLQLIDNLIENEQTLEEDVVLLVGDEERTLQIRGSQMIDAEQAVGVLIVMRDVTSLRKLESMRRDFVSNVSHELKTPLTSIRGFGELIESQPTDQELVSNFSGKIVKQSVRMISIIEDLLDLARIEGADEPPAFSASLIHPILLAVIEQCNEAAYRRHLTINLNCPETLSAHVHAPLYEQAVLNLVHNAVKYTQPDTQIDVKAFEDDHELVFQVTDEGPGIAPQHHQRLFERFYRVDKARSRAAGGTGLGLSIVKHIAQVHGGKITVSSKLGEGSTFTLRVPLSGKNTPES